MPSLLLLMAAASALVTLSSAETTQICPTEDDVHGKLFVAQSNQAGTELNVLTADLPSNAHEFVRADTVLHSSSVTLNTDGVSDLQHERVVETSTSIVTLTRDALVIVDSEEGKTVLVSIDANCKPHRLYARNPDDVIYVLCRDKSRVFKLASEPSSGYELTEIEWDLTDGVDSPAVAFPNGDHVAAAVLKRGLYEDDEYSYHYNWIEFKQDIEVDDHPIRCEDTYYIDDSCDSDADRLRHFNATHLILECENTHQQYLLEIGSLKCKDYDTVGVTSLELQEHVTGTAVGPDEDTFVINYGTSVHVQRNHFEQSYFCDPDQPILRLDYVDANYVVLFTATGTFSCDPVTNLTPLSVSDQFFSYAVEGTRLFVATSSSSSIAITVFDVENTCQFEFNSVSSISLSPGPLPLFAFVEATPPTVDTTSTTTAPSIPSTSTVTLPTTTPPTASPVIATTPPPSPPAAYVVVLAAVVVSVVAVVTAIVLTVCIVLLCKKCGPSKSSHSLENPPQSPIQAAQTISIGRSSSSLFTPVQETVECPHVPACNGPCSTNWTIQPLWETRLVTPYPEVRQFLERVPVSAVAPQNPVPFELYLSDAVLESTVDYPYTSTSYSTQL